MYFAPKSLSTEELNPEHLRQDKQESQAFGECGLGKKAVYLPWMLMSRRRYIPLHRLQRVFKRLAVSKGFFEEGKIFGTIPYLVLQYDNGKERVVRFEHEEHLDAMLNSFREHTGVPVGKNA